MNHAPTGDDYIFIPVEAPFSKGGFNIDCHDGNQR